MVMANADDNEKRDQLRQRLAAKRRLEKQSLDSIEALLEKNITEDQLLEHCRNLWQQSYQDCTEERALIQLCGYPLCDNKVPPQNQKMPKYKICMRSKKVYSTEKQRIFCQLKCHQRSEWLKSQLSEVPFWLLDATYNKEINLLCEKQSNYIPAEFDGNVLPRRCQVTVKEVEELTQSIDHVSIEGNSISSRPKPYSRNSAKQSSSPPFKESSEIFSVLKLEKLLCDWFTVGTLQYIVGDERFNQLIAECQDTLLLSELNQFDEVVWNRYSWQKPFDECSESGEADSNSIQKQLPNSNAAPLSKRNNLNTKTGERRVALESTDHSLAKPVERSSFEPVLPLIAAHHQRKIREKILLDNLSPVMDTVRSRLNLSGRDLAKDVTHMIRTFRLKSYNCMLRPNEAVVVFVVIMMLIDRKAGGEGQISQEIRTILDGSLRNAGLSYGDICVALQKATEPRRLFEDARRGVDDYSV